MNRRRILLLAVPAVLLVTLAAGWLLRTVIAEQVIRIQIGARGLDSQLDVTSLGFSEAELRDIRIAELRISRMNVRFSVGQLWRGVVDAVAIDGFAMPLNLTGEGPVLGELQRLLETEGESAWEQLPALRLRNARLTLRLPRETLPVDVTADIRRLAGSRATADLRFAGAARTLRASGTLRSHFNGLVPSDGVLRADLSDHPGTTRFALRVATQSPTAARPQMLFHLTGSGAVAVLARELALPPSRSPTAGRFELAADGQASFSAAPEPFAAPQLSTTVEVHLSDVMAAADTAPDWLQQAGGRASATARYGGNALAVSASGDFLSDRSGTRVQFDLPDARFAMRDDGSVSNVQLSGLAFSGAAIPTPFGTLRTVDVKGSLSGSPAEPAGQLALQLASDELDIAGNIARRVSFQGPATLRSRAGVYSLALSGPGSVSLGELRLPALLPLRGAQARVTAASLDMRSAPEGWSFEQTAVVNIPKQTLRVERKDAGPLAMDLTLRPVSVRLVVPPVGASQIRAESAIASLVIPEAALMIRDSRATVSGDPAGVLQAQFTGGTLTHQAETPMFAALVPQLTVVRRGSTMSIEGSATRTGGLNIRADGAYDLLQGRGRLRFVQPEIRFERTLQPGAVSPLLASMESVTGSARGEGEVTWDANGFETRGVVALTGLSFVREGFEVEGVTTTLTLDQLVPPRSVPGQRLTIRRIAAGADVTGLDLRYALAGTADGSPRLAVEALRLAVLGGELSARDGTIEPTLGNAALTLDAARIDMASLIRQIGFQELAAEGRLSGRIPLRIEQGVTQISGGELRAEGPGRIMFKSADARRALAQGGETVKLMLDALEDFRYELLHIDVDKPSRGDSKVLIRLNGHNPAVLDGQRFNFNINLTGNIEPLLDALAEGRRLRNELLQPLFRLQGAPSNP